MTDRDGGEEITDEPSTGGPSRVPPDIFGFLSYRDYLRAWFEAKAGRPSLRGLAYKLGCSPAALSQIVNGSRALLPPLLEKLTGALGLADAGQAQFLLLVEYEQNQSPTKRSEALDRIMAARRYHSARRIVDAMYLVFSRWYFPAILELVRCEGFREDPAWIAETLMPRVSEAEAAEALEVLTSVGFLERDAQGRLRAADTTFATEHEVSRMTGPAVANLHRWLLARAPAALEEVPFRERYFSTVSLSLSEEGFEELKKHVQRFDEDVLTRFLERPNPTRVYQLSLQVFPLTRPTR